MSEAIQYDLLDAIRAREEAITRVNEHADAEWMDVALTTIQCLAAVSDYFTTDDVWEAMHAHDESTHEPRAMGAAMRRAARAGWVAPTANYRPSARPSCHARPVRVWGSLIREAS